MQFLFELLGQALIEVVAYQAGKGFVILFLPHLGIEPFGRTKGKPHQKRRGFTYQQNSRTFLYTESVQWIGLGVLVLLGICIFLIVRFAP